MVFLFFFKKRLDNIFKNDTITPMNIIINIVIIILCFLILWYEIEEEKKIDKYR